MRIITICYIIIIIDTIIIVTHVLYMNYLSYLIVTYGHLFKYWKKLPWVMN
jgi:hypothetical protein